jgi:hypothetical protein
MKAKNWNSASVAVLLIFEVFSHIFVLGCDLETFKVRSKPPLEDITFVVKRPTNGDCVGFFFYSTWQKDPNTLRENLNDDTSWIKRFCEEHNLAIVTWSTEGLINSSQNQLQRELLLNEMCYVWNDSVNDLILKDDDYTGVNLIYGISRGATYAQALVKRYPGRFDGIHVHLCGFFETPGEGQVPENGPIWLLSTGEFDFNRRHTFLMADYLSKNGQIPIVKSSINLGHELSSDIDSLSETFFRYVIKLKKERDSTGRPVRELHRAKTKSAKLKRSIIVATAPEANIMSEIEWKVVQLQWRCFRSGIWSKCKF